MIVTATLVPLDHSVGKARPLPPLGSEPWEFRDNPGFTIQAVKSEMESGPRALVPGSRGTGALKLHLASASAPPFEGPHNLQQVP